MAKRSPILGYNHNVRYRGLVFHVQTEDSGVMSPHLFTHLFHGGVIVSTRKLVYDSGSAEDAIKSLMQAQHKAVMKELRRGVFNDKIDEYLGGTPGLLPREAEPVIDDGVPEPVVGAATERASVEPSEPILTIEHEPPSEPIKPRTKTADRTSQASRNLPPPPVDYDAPTLGDTEAAAVAAALSAELSAATAVTAPTARAVITPPRTTMPRAATPPPIPSRAGAVSSAAAARSQRPSAPQDSSPEITITRADSGRARAPRDTSVDDVGIDAAVPSAVGDDATRPSDGVPSRGAGDSIPPMPPPPRTHSDRPASQSAATLPPMARQPARPAITPPTVMSRPLASADRNRGESDGVEVYAPAPASAEPPPGERAERPGQYSVGRASKEAPLREKTGRMDVIPAGLGRPRPASSGSGSVRVATPSTPASGSTVTPAVGDGADTEATRAPQPIAKEPSRPDSNRVIAPRAAPHLTAPMASRTPSPNHGGVVTTRPAVIVGAPPRTATPPRVRQAREDEGRGFGQGLISEKSLDEVILAYLSEDAEEK